MRHKLKTAVAVAALQLVALFPGAAGAAPAPRAKAADGVASQGRGAPTSAKRARRPRRRPAAGDALIPGVWGGERVRFEVTERGANVEYDCAHGTVEGKIIVDGRGRFDVAGTHYEEGGPARSDEAAAGRPVRLSGVVGGSLLKLTVRRADTKELIGTFSLARDRETELRKCR